MTLRVRLVAALAGLATIGLVVFGVTTYELYSRSQYQRLDEQLRNAVPVVTHRLGEQAGLAGIGGFGGLGPDGSNAPAGDQADRQGDAPPGGPPLLSAYGELRDASGRVLSQLAPSNTSSRPKLPNAPANGPHEQLLTVGSTSGSQRWRVQLNRTGGPGGQNLVSFVAVPLGGVADSLHRFVLIETLAAAGLLVVLAAGSWLILRRGLRPLEHMAATAGTISAGALDQRVAPDDPRTEIGQLGHALNTMLGELEQSFAERAATEARLRQFLADASHELRTPLTSIQGFAELFRLGVAEKDHVNLDVISRRIEAESARMKGLVESLLLLARLDQTRELAAEPVNLAVLAADACSDAVAIDPDRRITLDAPAPVVVLGDPDHLRQAVGNLTANTLRHTPAGSPVEVSARVVDGRAVVQVRDHGPGLDPDALVHAFDRFWQADAARQGTGAGLGLAIVASIAEEHGGEATAANAPDGGAVFTLTLPLHAPS